MAYPTAAYNDSSSYTFYTELPMDRVVDPEIKRSVSPTNTAGPWAVYRYLSDKHKPSFVMYPAMDSVSPGIISPFPVLFQRGGSPSFTISSSTCGSALSSPSDTDYCQARSPPANPDVPSMPQYENWSHVYNYTGLADGCVNLGDVNPVQDLPLSYCDENTQQFDTSIRTCSMSSAGSNNYDEAWNNNDVLPLPKTLDPDITIGENETPILDTVEVSYTEAHKSPSLKIEPVDGDESDIQYPPQKISELEVPQPTRNSKSHKRRSDSSSSSEAKRTKTIGEPLVIRGGPKPSIQSTKGQYTCPECIKVSFKDQTTLDNHIKKQHTRPFTCIFDFAGCTSTFASKNEWKRHCTSQHIGLQYWVCQQGSCEQHSNRPTTGKRTSGAMYRRPGMTHSTVQEAPALPNGSIFNRKDLYTQHLRRMHVPSHLKKEVKSKKHVPEWEERQRAHQAEAIRTRCQLPTHMLCPAAGCNVQFDGINAWDERMEHVAKHLERAAVGLEPHVQFGGDNDRTLVSWAANPAIGILKRDGRGRWVLQNPLKCHESSAEVIAKDDEDADAEGEEVDY